MTDGNIKQDVRQFYDKIGWQMEIDGFYQNARYEDLRPVSREYIHNCHLRINRHISSQGHLLLDAGSGPIQYPEYVTYSDGYDYRVCLDISIVALKEARKRIGDKGLFVVADVSNLPFKPEVFDGIVSLHTLHHLPQEDQIKAYFDLSRVLKTGKSAVLVNGWTVSPLMENTQWLVNLMERIGRVYLRLKNGAPEEEKTKSNKNTETKAAEKVETGTFIKKLDAQWLKEHLGKEHTLEIFSWRSVSVRFLRAVVHRQLAGKFFLKWLYLLEEKFPVYFGEKGQYPLIVIKK
ncbi:MAG: class I SAM-dependent methyltransferase [Anaerolineaceae bacterium]|nr:class I SAM-dependent methyltransferase [Anaerolineaceae bacterium]